MASGAFAEQRDACWVAALVRLAYSLRAREVDLDKDAMQICHSKPPICPERLTKLPDILLYPLECHTLVQVCAVLLSKRDFR